jgi:hypothetical protein
VPDEWEDVGRGADLDALGLNATAGELDSSHNQGSLCLANAFETHQIVGAYVETFFIHETSDFGGKVHDVDLGATGA